jgi:single-strand DNA-binding protein
MFETQVTLVGQVASDVKFTLSKRPEGEDDLSVARFRVASTTRKFDKAQQAWVNGDTVFATAVCFRRMAEHVTGSLKRGDPVMVHGKMQMRSWRDENRSGHELEIIATAVGHNLLFGTAMFSKSLFRTQADSAESLGAEEPFSPVADGPSSAQPMAEVTPLPGASDIRSVGAVDASGVLPTRPREERTSPHPTSSDPSTTADEQAA